MNLPHWFDYALNYRLHGLSPSPQLSRRYPGPGNPGVQQNQYPLNNQFATLPQARLSSADRNKSGHRSVDDTESQKRRTWKTTWVILSDNLKKIRSLQFKHFYLK